MISIFPLVRLFCYHRASLWVQHNSLQLRNSNDGKDENILPVRRDISLGFSVRYPFLLLAFNGFCSQSCNKVLHMTSEMNIIIFWANFYHRYML